MAEHAVRGRTIHRWYTRLVFFVADVNRAVRVYVDMLGFEKGWHSGDGAGTVCQVNRGECEIILCEDATRRDGGRLFIELTADGLVDLRREFAERRSRSRHDRWRTVSLPVGMQARAHLVEARPRAVTTPSILGVSGGWVSAPPTHDSHGYAREAVDTVGEFDVRPASPCFATGGPELRSFGRRPADEFANGIASLPYTDIGAASRYRPR
jgi:hypothetical protein